jgi:hypothetical protein
MGEYLLYRTPLRPHWPVGGGECSGSPRREDDGSLASNAEVKIAWNYIMWSLSLFMEWPLIYCRGNFILPNWEIQKSSGDTGSRGDCFESYCELWLALSFTIIIIITIRLALIPLTPEIQLSVTQNREIQAFCLLKSCCSVYILNYVPLSVRDYKNFGGMYSFHLQDHIFKCSYCCIISCDTVPSRRL